MHSSRLEFGTDTANVSPAAAAGATGSAGELRRVILGAFLYAVPVLMVLPKPVVDPDLWWHLGTARWIVAHGWVPTTDPFSAYGEGKPWMAYSWLFELIVYGLYQQFGLLGIVAFRAAGALAVTAAVHRLVGRREPRLLHALGWTFLGVLALSPLLQERSWVFSVVFYALTLDVVFDARAGRPNGLTWWLPALYALWANVHIQFVHGLVALGLAVGAEVLERLFGRVAPAEQSAWAGRLLRLGTLLAACAVATLLNPYTWRLYPEVLRLAGQPGAYRWIGELQALSFRRFPDWLVLGLTCLAAAKLGSRPRLVLFEVILLISGAVLAFRAQREVWLVVLSALALLSPGPQAVPAVRVPWPRRALHVGLGTVVVLALILAVVPQFGLTNAALNEELTKHYPVAATEAVIANNYPGPVYNHFNWGGYLIWRLPHLKVSVDGRFNIFDDAHLERSIQTIQGLHQGRSDKKEGWRSDPDLTAAGIVLLPIDVPLAYLLHHHPDSRFVRKHADGVAAVFVVRAE